VKTLFFGTSAFAVPSLRVVAERTQCAGAVTQPDRPAGRGRQRLKKGNSAVREDAPIHRGKSWHFRCAEPE